MQVSESELADFLSIFFADMPGLVAISKVSNGHLDTGFHPAAEAGELASRIAEIDAEDMPPGWYVRMTTLATDPGEGKRGNAATSMAIRCLWGDLDFGTIGHAPPKDGQLPNAPDEESAMKIVDAAVLPNPTIWIHSGGGLYPLWMFKPELIADRGFHWWRGFSEAWQARLVAGAAALGYGSQPVGDLARVLRLPGTVNRKEGLERPCKVISHEPDNVFTVDDLAALIEYSGPNQGKGPSADREQASGEAIGRPGGWMTAVNQSFINTGNDPEAIIAIRPSWTYSDGGSETELYVFTMPGGSSQRSAVLYQNRPSGIYILTNRDDRLQQGKFYTFYNLLETQVYGSRHKAMVDLGNFASGDDGAQIASVLAKWPEALERLREDLNAGKAEDETEDIDDEGFWTSRPELTTIRDFARSRMVSRWALLGAVITRALATVPVEICLPPTICGKASVNFACGLVGHSGASKSGTFAVAREVLPTSTDTVSNLGTGEGIARSYGFTTPIPKKDVPAGGLPFTTTRTAFNLVFEESEIGSFEKLIQRSGATLETTLRKAITGEELGVTNADSERKLKLLSTGGYRFGLLVGIQAELAGAILDGTAGGTPQRLIWMPATDESISAEVIEDPQPLKVLTTEWIRTRQSWNDEAFLSIPAEVATAIRHNHARNMQGKTDVLDGHAMLTREKVAYGLALLNRRVDGFTLDDWELAGMVMEVSDHTRKNVLKVLNRESEKRIKAQGKAVAIREQAAAQVRASGYIPKVREKLAQYPDSIGRGKFLRLFASSSRDAAGDALDELIAAGEVVENVSQNRNRTGTTVQLK